MDTIEASRIRAEDRLSWLGMLLALVLLGLLTLWIHTADDRRALDDIAADADAGIVQPADVPRPQHRGVVPALHSGGGGARLPRILHT